MTKEQKDVVYEMYKNGWNPEDISDETGYDEMEVIEYCAEILQL